jgi:EAL domain-containing protein (putative c-di-GMP-specific phosphodiesterase class I)
MTPAEQAAEGSELGFLLEVETMEPPEVIRRALTAVNERLGTEAAAVAQFVEGKRVSRFAEGDAGAFGVVLGEPQRDTTGFSVSAPVRFRSGDVYGTLWAARRAADPPFGEHDVEFLALIASLIGEQIEREATRSAAHKAIRERLARVIDDPDALTIVFQPIVDLVTGEWKGVESLARFGLEPKRPPNVWFEEAWVVGLGEELELIAVRKALAEFHHLPPGMYMAFNVSPETLIRPELTKLVAGHPLERLVFEITEHAEVESYQLLREAFAPLREQGARLAVDDAGAGYASMLHIINLSPDIIKLDGSLTQNVEGDPARNALTTAMVLLATRIGARLVAEVVETAEAVATLRALAVHTAQGWFFSKPRPPKEIAAEAPRPKPRAT